MKSHIVLVIFLSFQTGYGYPKGPEEEPLVQQESSRDPREIDTDQSFYPSFSPFQNPPGGHSRPFFFGQQEGAYSQRPYGGFPQQLSYEAPRFSGYKDSQHRASSDNTETHASLLGSGNFGVIRGGTFYDKTAEAENSNYDNEYYFGNGHGRPSSNNYRGVPNPRAYQHEQFENFRDFADINAPANPAYSEYVVVYVNKNSTKLPDVKNPKNIIERLELLDREENPERNKMSKSKRKLAKTLNGKKHKTKKIVAQPTTRDLNEPLLALS